MENPPITQTPSLVLEWRIEDFSCWINNEAWDNAIICRESSLSGPSKNELVLYPKGKGGKGERMEVIFLASNNLFREEVDLSFLGPDGSLLYARRVNQINSGMPNRVLGPKFLDVFFLIQQKEDLHGDHLTLQFLCKNPPANRIYMRTTLDVFDASFKIAQPFDDRLSNVWIASVSYHNRGSDVKERMQVIYSNVKKTLCLVTSIENSSPVHLSRVRCKMSDYDKSNSLVKRDTCWSTLPIPAAKPMFKDFLSTLESGGHSILRLKIVSGNYRSHRCDFFQSSSPLINASKITNAFSLVKSKSSFSLSEDLRCLYQDGEFPDLTLRCGTVSFPVHRNILGARSPVFKTMLSSDMIEAASGSVDIEDLDATSLDHFLTYLYTGTFKDVPCDSALKLYYAADKYQVPSLKEECAHFLSANVSVSNACNILCLGDIYEDDQLTCAAQNFILKHPSEVTSSKEWQDLMQTNPQLLVKTFNHFAANGFVGYPCL